MKIEVKKHYQPSFQAKVVHNQSLRTALRDIKNRYGQDYARKAYKQICKLGSDKDEIKFVYSTFAYKKSLGMSPKAEGVTFALLNGKHIGHFENRFVSNFIKATKEKIKEQTPKINEEYKNFSRQFKTKKNIQTKNDNKFIKFLKKIIKYYREEY